MSEMIERVARASFACWRKRMDELGHHMDRSRTFEDMHESEHEFALMNARVMIEAMREPTEAMVKAAEAALFEHLPEARDWSFLATKEAYQAMIDEALK